VVTPSARTHPFPGASPATRHYPKIPYSSVFAISLSWCVSCCMAESLGRPVRRGWIGAVVRPRGQGPRPSGRRGPRQARTPAAEYTHNGTVTPTTHTGTIPQDESTPLQMTSHGDGAATSSQRVGVHCLPGHHGAAARDGPSSSARTGGDARCRRAERAGAQDPLADHLARGSPRRRCAGVPVSRVCGRTLWHRLGGKTAADGLAAAFDRSVNPSSQPPPRWCGSRPCCRSSALQRTSGSP